MSEVRRDFVNIAFDSQILFERQKTGIGRNSEAMINHYIELDSDNIVLNYFKMLDESSREKVIEHYLKNNNVKINKCKWFHNVLFNKIVDYFPIPYSLFFREKVDITQFFNYVIPTGVRGKAALYIYDMAYKVYPETIGEKTLKMLNNSLEKSSKRADCIITISEFSKSEIMKYLEVSSDKIAVIPCAVDNATYNDKIDDERISNVKKKYGIIGSYFLYLGTLEPRKNIERLIDAYAMLVQCDKDVPILVLAGKNGWNYERIYKKVEDYGLDKIVIFTGYLTSVDAVALLKGAFTFVFPSIYEGFGMPPLEAMACGIPVITSNVSSLPEVVKDAGYLINPFSVEDIYNAMLKLAKNKEERIRLRQKGLERAKKFTWRESAKLLREAYIKMM